MNEKVTKFEGGVEAHDQADAAARELLDAAGAFAVFTVNAETGEMQAAIALDGTWPLDAVEKFTENVTHAMNMVEKEWPNG